MHVILIAPRSASDQIRFIRGLKRVGARVSGVSDVAPGRLPIAVKRSLDGYEQVGDVADVEQVTRAVRDLQKRGPWVHHLESTSEALAVVAAEVRERVLIPGASLDLTQTCADRILTRDRLRAAGIPCGSAVRAATVVDARSFAASHGYPLLLRPCASGRGEEAHRVDDEAGLMAAATALGLGSGVEVMIEPAHAAHEGFFDTLTVGGEVMMEFVGHRYPSRLEADGGQGAQIVVTNRLDAVGYGRLRVSGRKVISELGVSTAATHLRWSVGPRGLQIDEVGTWPAAYNLWELYGAANDFDMYEEWARALCWGTIERQPSRRYAAGLVAVRPRVAGEVVGYSGLDEVQRRHGAYILDAWLPPPGARVPTIADPYLGCAWVRVRHPDYDACRHMLDDIGETLRMRTV